MDPAPLTPVRKLRLAAAWLASLYFANLYGHAGWQKFDTESFWTGLFEQWGYPPSFRVLVGVVELVGGIALVVPWVATYAGAALVVVMGGAWVHLAMDARWSDVGLVTAYLTGLTWIAWEWRILRIGGRTERANP